MTQERTNDDHTPNIDRAPAHETPMFHSEKRHVSSPSGDVAAAEDARESPAHSLPASIIPQDASEPLAGMQAAATQVDEVPTIDAGVAEQAQHNDKLERWESEEQATHSLFEAAREQTIKQSNGMGDEPVSKLDALKMRLAEDCGNTMATTDSTARDMEEAIPHKESMEERLARLKGPLVPETPARQSAHQVEDKQKKQDVQDDTHTQDDYLNGYDLDQHDTAAGMQECVSDVPIFEIFLADQYALTLDCILIKGAHPLDAEIATEDPVKGVADGREAHSEEQEASTSNTLPNQEHQAQTTELESGAAEPRTDENQPATAASSIMTSACAKGDIRTVRRIVVTPQQARAISNEGESLLFIAVSHFQGLSQLADARRYS